MSLSRNHFSQDQDKYTRYIYKKDKYILVVYKKKQL